MVEGEYHIPFETGKQDLFAANMLDRSAIGRWMSDPEGMGKALAERYTRQDLFAQMTKDQLVDTALMLSKEAEEMPVWDPSEEKSDSRIWPNRTSLQSMKKDALVSYLGAVYQRANLFLLLQLDFHSFLHLLQIADQDQAPLISIVPEEAEEAASKEGRVDLFEEYSDPIYDGFLVPKRLCRFSNMRFYGLFMPDEVRALLREQGGELILERMLLDILDCYARAAAHLYGVVTMDDLPKIVGRYEARIAKDGVMNDAVAELDAMILAAKRDGNLDDLRNLTDRRKVISRMLIELSADGMMGQVQMAKGKYEDYDLLPLELDGKKTIILVGGELMDRVPDDDALSHTVFGLLDDQKGKSRYYPATYERFMGYADGLVNDDVPAAKHLARLAAWLEKKHREEIVRAIEKAIKDRTNAALRMKYTEINDETVGIAANEIVADLYREIVYGTRNPIQSGMGLKTLEEKYDLLTRNVAEANEYLNLWNEVNSNSRMFSNNGNTPLELRAKMPPHQGPTKLIFGSGLQGTDIPEEIQRAIQSGKFHGQLTVDDAEVKRASVKIGRNDPCPCGSGKKYKHCCGKNKP